MKRYLLAAAILMAPLGAAEANAAVTTIVNPTATKTTALSSTLAPDTIGQVFVPTEGLLTGLGFRFGSSTTATTGTVTLSLYAGAIAPNAVLPTTSLFSQQYSLAGLVFRGVGSFTDLFTGSLAVDANTAYTAILSGSSNVQLAFANTDGYVPGYLLQTTVNDAVCRSTPASCDASFRFSTAAAAAAVPEPAAWALMLLGLGMAGGAMRHQRRRAGATHA